MSASGGCFTDTGTVEWEPERREDGSVVVYRRDPNRHDRVWFWTYRAPAPIEEGEREDG